VLLTHRLVCASRGRGISRHEPGYEVIPVLAEIASFRVRWDSEPATVVFGYPLSALPGEPGFDGEPLPDRSLKLVLYLVERDRLSNRSELTFATRSGALIDPRDSPWWVGGL
jgi:hypothetical protein